MSHTQIISQSPRYPLKVMSLVLLLVFVVEGLIMLILPYVSPWPHGSVGESIADAALLSTALAPALWFMIVRPLRSVLNERGNLLRRLFETQEIERSALARDLHDELGQHLTAMLVGLRALQSSDESEQVRLRAGELLRLTSESLKEVRRLASGLRVGVLEDFGLPIAIERLCEDFSEAHGILPDFTAKLAPQRRFGHEIETALYRVCQEALTNVARHAQATSVYISLTEEGRDLHLLVRDDGKGIGASPSDPRKGVSRSLGLRSMRERVELLGGKFAISSGENSGTRIEVRIQTEERDVQEAQE